MQITICGGGNAAHALAGLLASKAGLRVAVFAPFGREAELWGQGIDERGGIAVSLEGEQRLGRPWRVSARAQDVVPGARWILLALPAFAHGPILEAIAGHLGPGSWIGALPARSGFDLETRQTLTGKAQPAGVFGLQTLPWACRVSRFGQEVSILGTKAQVDLACWPPQEAGRIAAELEELIGVPLQVTGGFLSLDLSGTGQILHPGIMYSLFAGREVTPLPEAPLFYHGVEAAGARLLQAMSDDVQAIRARLEALAPDEDLTAVRPLDEWLRRSYSDQIADASTLHACLRTNRAYRGLRAPVVEVDGELLPDFHSRYLSEDVPYGLVVLRGVATLAGVPTPAIDRVIRWGQARLGRVYLGEAELDGVHLLHTRAPQRFGYRHLDQLLQYRHVPVEAGSRRGL